MNALTDFEQRVDQVLANARRRPDLPPAEADRYMNELLARRDSFEIIAGGLLSDIVRPRVEAIARRFSNAKLIASSGCEPCTCWFGYCERFPASVKLTIEMEHDDRFERLILQYDLQIRPVFIKYDAHDKLFLPLNEPIAKANSVTWLEDKLIGFLNTYLKLDRGLEESEEPAFTDPVCGMRLSKSAATCRFDYLGHPYYFCSAACRDQFAEAPKKFIWFVTLLTVHVRCTTSLKSCSSLPCQCYWSDRHWPPCSSGRKVLPT